MLDTSNLNAFGVVAIGFVPTLIFSSLLRSQGIAGLIAVIGIFSIALVILTDFQDWKLAIGGISALFGLIIGGNISDANERKRMAEKKALEVKQRKKLLS